MGYRIVADENVEPATRRHLDARGHDIEWVGDVSSLGLGVADEKIVAYANREERLILTQDDDFFTRIDVEETAGVLYQQDQQLSAEEVATIVDEMARYLDQSTVTLEYVSRNWLSV